MRSVRGGSGAAAKNSKWCGDTSVCYLSWDVNHPFRPCFGPARLVNTEGHMRVQAWGTRLDRQTGTEHGSLRRKHILRRSADFAGDPRRY
jgi:hypothetical protein